MTPQEKEEIKIQMKLKKDADSSVPHAGVLAGLWLAMHVA
jgi:hypothetical protein